MIDDVVERLRRRRDRDRLRRGLGPRAAVDRRSRRSTRSGWTARTCSSARPTASRPRSTAECLSEELLADAHSAYDAREETLGAEVMRELERRVLLSVLDRKWREHLYEMDYLQEGIGLRAMAKRDPLVEYQREGFDMFTAMMDGIKEESVGFLFNLEVQTQEQQEAEAREAQAAAEAEALARAEEGTRRVLARQAAEAEAEPRPRPRRLRRRRRAPPSPRSPDGARSPRPPRPLPRQCRVRAVGPEAAGQPASASATARAPAEPVEHGSPSGTGPELAVKGLEAPKRSGEPHLLGAGTGRLGQAERRRQGGEDGDRDRHQGARAERAVPLRLGQEVQGLPREARPLTSPGSPRAPRVRCPHGRGAPV